MASTYFSAFMSTVLSTPFMVAVFFVIAVRIATSSDWYKKVFAKNESKFAQVTARIFAPLKAKIFTDLSERLEEVKGDVLEIGIGAGENFHYYPEGTTVIAVDPNPHVEELLRENLKKVCDRVQLKKFVAASAEDMSCAPGKPGVEDNSVGAVVCTLVLCSMTDDQMTKILQEVKRVLMPGGRFYFLEHVAGKPWTFQYLLQHLLTKSLFFPTFLNGCRCNKETLSRIQEVGFKMVKAEKKWLDWNPETFSGFKDTFAVWGARMTLPIVNSVISGFAEK